MKIADWIVLVSIPALLCLAGEGQSADIQNENSALEGCGALSQAGMRACLEGKSQESATALKQAENKAVDTLSKWDEDAKYIFLAKQRLTASSKAYEQYREAQCAFASSIGGGAIASALELRRLACLIGLNTRRTAHIRAMVSSLPTK
ncbi:MAG: lysozyme inhibitor LprI family protein [Telluria sp.]|nr:lysozyme inhibitor LprI family protein [Telluria sp.]